MSARMLLFSVDESEQATLSDKLSLWVGRGNFSFLIDDIAWVKVDPNSRVYSLILLEIGESIFMNYEDDDGQTQ